MSTTPDKAELATKKVFTTGEAAAICKVSQQTIIRCFDSGRLVGFRVPGSKFRRIPRDELIRFMRSNNIPTHSLDGAGAGRKRVLVVDDDPNIVELFVDILSKHPQYEVKTAGTGYDAGMLTESFRPHLILLDFMLPDINGNVVCSRIRGNPDIRDTKIVFISGAVDADEIKSLSDAGADAFIKKPFKIEDLLTRIADLLGSPVPVVSSAGGVGDDE